MSFAVQCGRFLGGLGLLWRVLFVSVVGCRVSSFSAAGACKSLCAWRLSMPQGTNLFQRPIRFGFLSRRLRRKTNTRNNSILGRSLHHVVVCASTRTVARTGTRQGPPAAGVCPRPEVWARALRGEAVALGAR